MALIDPTSAYLNQIDLTDADVSARVNALIEAASEYIEKYCNRIFLADDYTEVQNGTGYNSIFVENPPINSLTEITFISGSDETDYADTNFDYDYRTGEIRFGIIPSDAFEFFGYFPVGFQNIRITYNGGFTTVPDPIQLVCAEMVKELLDPTLSLQNVEDLKLGQFFIGWGKQTADKIIMKNKKILSMYKLVHV